MIRFRPLPDSTPLCSSQRCRAPCHER